MKKLLPSWCRSGSGASFTDGLDSGSVSPSSSSRSSIANSELAFLGSARRENISAQGLRRRQSANVYAPSGSIHASPDRTWNDSASLSRCPSLDAWVPAHLSGVRDDSDSSEPLLYEADPDFPDRPEFIPQTPSQSLRKSDGILDRMKRQLRITPGTVSVTPFISRKKVPPTPARALLDTEHKLRTPSADATMPSALPGRKTSTANSFAGSAGVKTPAGSAVLQSRKDTEIFIRHLFDGTTSPPGTTKEMLVARLAGLSEDGNYIKVRSTACALAEVAGGDIARATAALDVLQGLRNGPPQARLDSFLVQLSLAKTDLGHEALLALRPEPIYAGDSPADAKIRQSASRHALQAADRLMANLSKLSTKIMLPTSVEEAVEVANAMLPPEQRSTKHAGVHNARAALQAGTDLFTARALVCAHELQVDPASMPHQALRAAYFAWRNDFDGDGKGTDLEKARSRLFKMITYAERAAAPRASFMKRVLGMDKSPLSALALGTAGGRLKHPHQDFERLDVIDAVVEQMNQTLARDIRQFGLHEPTVLHSALRRAVHIVAACEYKEILKEGWRDKVQVNGTMRKNISTRVAESLGVSRGMVENHYAFEDLKSVNAKTLRTWAEMDLLDDELQLPPELNERLNSLEKLQKNGDWFPKGKEKTPEKVMELLRDVAATARTTFDVRYSDGGVHGINGNLAGIIADAASFVAIPTAIAGPDVKLVQGRQAMVNIGSSSHGGTLFVGTDTRRAVHMGASAIAAWSPFKIISATAGTQVLPFLRERSSPKGVMIRTRMQALDPSEQGEPWREKLLSVIDTIGQSGTEGAMPKDKTEMWDALSAKFFKDPDMSLNWMETKSVNISSTLSGTAGVRGVALGGYKAGLMGSLGASRFWSNKMHRKDDKGAMKVETVAHSQGRGLALGAALIASPKPVGDLSQTPGHVSQMVLPSAPLLGGTLSLLTTSTGATLRIAHDGDRILPNVTFRDLEFTNVADYLKYVDSRNGSWTASVASREDGQLSAGGEDVLDKFLTEVQGNADRGNQIFAERQVMTPEAARSIDELREAGARMVPAGKVSTKSQQAAMDALNARIAVIMEDDSSWRNRFLFVMESNTDQKVVGNSYLLQAQTQMEVSHLRMTAALAANDWQTPVTRSGV